MFFADRDTGASDNTSDIDQNIGDEGKKSTNDIGEAVGEKDENSNISSENDGTLETSEKGILPEVRGEENMAKETKGEDKETIHEDQNEWREKTFASIENVIVSGNKRVM